MHSTARAFTDLISWFHSHKRFFPWRELPTPYSVWISEVMLQQTQAARVVSFFLRWMERFPYLHDLSQSSEEEVLKLWEGLGYYSRARALLKGACFVEEHFQGQLPKERELLLSIPGIGPYTQGAIRSFAFHERAAAVDANVERVISRWMDLPVQKGTQSSREQIESILADILPKSESWVAMEALIELGALVCQKEPSCHKCPLRKECRAFMASSWHERPLVTKISPRIKEKRLVLLFQKEDAVCVVRREGRAAMSGLWEFPYIPFPETLQSVLDGLGGESIISLESVTHSYTKYVVTLFPYVVSVEPSFSWHEGEWIPQERLATLAFSSGHKRVLEQLLLF